MQTSNRRAAFGLLLTAVTAAAAAQTEYSRRVTGSMEISAAGQVLTYTMQPAGAPAIDQSLGNLVESWRFNPPPGGKTLRVEFSLTLLRASLDERTYTLKRVEFFPQGAQPAARGAGPDDQAYCRQAEAAPRSDVICPAVLPADPALAAMPVSAEAYIALRKTDSGAEAVLESLYLYGPQNGKLLNRALSLGKQQFAPAALAWANKNALALLQGRDYFVTRVEFVQANNTLPWRRQEKVQADAADWLTDTVRAKTVYVSQGGLELQ